KEGLAMQRPTAVTVFGVLNIVFGVMAVTCTPFALITTKLSQRMLDNLPEASRMENPVQEMMQSPGFMTYTYVSTAVGMAFGALLIAAGIGLLKLRPWARLVSIGYAVYSWVGTAAGQVIAYFLLYAPMLETAPPSGGPASAAFVGPVVGAVVGSCVSLVYPTILLIFMLRPEIRAAFQPGWGTPPPVPPGLES
ncbi:MAG TPA: hypothetical protein PLB67_11725, partial [Candidatus Hydrogenedentes bacterium]|nr:hypothetical protein [Candidatus Hydrogenedentota bacterium]